jgi:hypothetical protein
MPYIFEDEKEPLPVEKRLNHSNAVDFALRLFELNRHDKDAIDPNEFMKAISSDAIAIVAFLEIEMDTSDRTRAVELALRTIEAYNRAFPASAQTLDANGLQKLAFSIWCFMRYGGEIVP